MWVTNTDFRKFQQARAACCEKLLANEKYCDAVAIVGPEAHRVPFIRALLANLSEPLGAALYGNFQEGSAREITLQDVMPEGFDVLIRSSCNLDPKMTPERAIHGFNAARLYLVDWLEVYCLGYLQGIEDITSLLRTMSLAAKLCVELPTKVQAKYWSTLLLKSKQVIQSPAFVDLHGSVVAQLIKLEEFEVDEQQLWSRLVEWSASAAQRPELLGPFAEAEPAGDAKRRAPEEPNGLGPHELAQQEAVLRLVSEHIRFGAMDKKFFFDKARSYLTREASEAVFNYFLLGETPGRVPVSNRSGLAGAEESFPIEVHGFLDGFAADPESSALATGGGMWRPTERSRPLLVKLEHRIQISRVELLFEPAGVPPEYRLSIPCTSSATSHLRCFAPTGSFEIAEFRVCNSTTRTPSQRAVPAMTKITVFGRRADKAFREQRASQMAKELIEEVHHQSVESAA